MDNLWSCVLCIVCFIKWFVAGTLLRELLKRNVYGEWLGSFYTLFILFSRTASDGLYSHLNTLLGKNGYTWFELWRALGDFIKNEVASGHYVPISEVIVAALRILEDRKSKLEALRRHLSQGAEQARAGEFVDDFTMDTFIDELDNEVYW